VDVDIFDVRLGRLARPVPIKVAKDDLSGFHVLISLYLKLQIGLFWLQLLLRVYGLAHCLRTVPAFTLIPRLSFLLPHFALVPLDHLELLLPNDAGEAVEGDLQFEEQAQPADEVEELESQVGQDLNRREDVLNGESTRVVSDQEDEKTREISHRV
jgi:hypothetical protein